MEDFLVIWWAFIEILFFIFFFKIDQVIKKVAVTKVKVSDFSAGQTAHWPTHEEGGKPSFY